MKDFGIKYNGAEIMNKLNLKIQNNKQNKNLIILVCYIDMRNIDPTDIPSYMQKVKDYLNHGKSKNEQIFFIPQGEYSTKIECIYPSFVLDSNIIEKQKLLLKELEEKLNDK
jgi:hypothetical protein